MPYIVSFIKYSSHIGPKVAKKYIEILQKKPPDDSLGDQAVRAAARATKDGIESLHITLVKENEFDEAVIRIGAAVGMFSEIEGYEFSIETWLTVEESQKMVGLRM